MIYITMLCAVQANQDVLAGLVEHLDTTSMAETLVRVVGADEQTAAFLAAPHLAWLAHTNILQLLLVRCVVCSLTKHRANLVLSRAFIPTPLS